MQPPVKRRKIEAPTIEEISFDNAARQEYLTGFHKRKLQRAKDAREAAERKARLERIGERKKLREERKADLERHVQEVNALLQPLQEDDGDIESQSDLESRKGDSWDGVSETPKVDHEAEYVDEDRYTTVVIEAMDLSKEGLRKANEDKRGDDSVDEEDKSEESRLGAGGREVGEKRKWITDKPKEKVDRPKKKKKKFRYESKGERKIARVKQSVRNSKQASARRAA